jgi:hypothetical protein
MTIQKTILAYLLGSLTIAVGCGEVMKADPTRGLISGAVTYNNKPLPAGTITFISKDGSTATDAPIRGGRYATDRAPVGLNYVVIDNLAVQYGNPAAYVPIPPKYANPEVSGLTAEVKAGESATLDIALKN